MPVVLYVSVVLLWIVVANHVRFNAVLAFFAAVLTHLFLPSLVLVA
jgi:hypothetical protein